ncbi:FAD-dependent monooxygenase [Nesterenkonia sp. AN1]|uniref:FAD-dependent monooxygenase n=1 Tax=Nesterenkonia sp. AN1 TaxID=652017 RepID=UPI0004B05280|nr:FAD-dependent monooxygenase [Nesterenkonia sp. AN1]
MAEVLVIGAGPVGLLLGGLLRRAGVDVEILEQREHGSADSRAIGIHAPVLAALEDSGLTARLLEQAVRVTRGEARAQGKLLGVVRFDQLSTRFPFVATLPQSGTEAALALHAPAPQRGIGVSALRPESDHVELDTSFGTHRAPLVVLAGGPRSRELVYRSALGHSYPDRYLMTDADAPDDQGPGTQMPARQDARTAVVHLESSGVLESFPLPGGRRRFVAWDSGAAFGHPASQAPSIQTRHSRTRPLSVTGWHAPSPPTVSRSPERSAASGCAGSSPRRCAVTGCWSSETPPMRSARSAARG